MYAFAPEKPPSLVGRNFCLAILRESIMSEGAMKIQPLMLFFMNSMVVKNSKEFPALSGFSFLNPANDPHLCILPGPIFAVKYS
jgi:hypothetical protein